MPRISFLINFVQLSLIKGRLLLGLLFFWNLALAEVTVDVDKISWSQLANDKIWLQQLQYRKTIMDGWKSEADESFFISANGKYDPVSELRATYDLFLKEPERQWGYVKQSVICAFPTRRRFLEEQLGIRFKSVVCADRDEWMKSFLGSQVYMVFSDAFPNNPASMFGHTFLLFSKNSQPDSAKGLLDYSINFSADTSSEAEKSILYTIKGLFGYFPGRYRVYKFYQLTNQYVNFDSRDLWYMNVPFNDIQLQRFLDHIWEIFSTSYFDYYFFDQNCSFRLLAAFDYADPDLDLIDEFYNRFPLYYVSPLATFRTVADRYHIKEVKYSASIRRRLRKQISDLTPEQYQNFNNLRKDMGRIGQESDIKTLDALTLFYDYRKRTTSADYLSEDVLVGLRNTLVRRAELPSPSEPEPKIVPRGTPLDSHRNKSVWLGLAQDHRDTNLSNSVVLGARAAYHDLLNASAGYDQWSDLTAVDTELKLNDSKNEVNFFKLVNIKSFFPVESYEIKPSWTTEGGYDAVYKNYFKGGAGLAIQNQDENLLGYLFFTPLLSSNGIVTSGRGYAFLIEAGSVLDESGFGRLWLYYLKNIGSSDDKSNSIVNSFVVQFSHPLKRDHEVRLRYFGKDTESSASFIYQLQF